MVLNSMTATLSLPCIFTPSATPINTTSSLSSEHRHSQLLFLLDRCTPFSHIKQIHALTLRTSPATVSLCNRLFYLYSFHHVDYSFRLFSQISNPSLFHWNTLIRACAHSSARKYDALLAFSEMLRFGRVFPDDRTFFFLLKASASSFFDKSAGKQAHSQIVKLGFGADVRVNSGLIHWYASRGLSKSACKLFDKMSVRDCVSWNLFIDVLVSLGEFEFALRTFLEMQGLYKPDGYTVHRIVSACVGLGASSLGMCVHGFLLKICDPAVWTDVLLNNLIVQMYSKNGMLTLAKQVFDRMPTRNVESWNSLILGFVMDRDVNSVLDCFDYMVKKDGFRPNSITFLGILNACKHKGMADEGLHYFNMMIMDYNIQPQSEHYECLVDICSHARFIDKDMELFSKMHLKPDMVALKSILLKLSEEVKETKHLEQERAASNDMGCEDRKCLKLESNHLSKETNDKEDEDNTNCSWVMSKPQTANHGTSAPLVTALKYAAEDNVASFHFPGHNRGQSAPSPLTELIGRSPYVHDLPELPELDNLFAPEGPILNAQKQAANIFGASETWFLTGGSTCGIQASIMATCSPGDTLILPRNCHISAISGMVLSGVNPKYIIPDYSSNWDIASPVTPSQVHDAIKDLESEGRLPAAVLITSPTYYGVCSNLEKISELCRSKGIPLIVDEAHGAHFGFHPKLPFSALKQGADLAVQSTHKVLCSLTQSSMLHSSGKLVDRDRITRCLQTLQSTSPSYLLLASLDAATAQLTTNPDTIFENSIHLANEAKSLIKQIPGLLVLELSMIDPLRLTVGVWELGLSGYKADEFLVKDQGVMCELVGSRSITFVFTPGTREDHVKRLILGFKNLSTSFFSCGRLDQSMKHMETESLGCTEMQLTPREAFFVRKRKMSVEDSIGKISGELVCPYPPGIPVLVPGELVTRKALDYIIEIKRHGGVITGASDPLLSSIVICDL